VLLLLHNAPSDVEGHSPRGEPVRVAGAIVCADRCALSQSRVVLHKQ
jgi:hypothetical protein